MISLNSSKFALTKDQTPEPFVSKSRKSHEILYSSPPLSSRKNSSEPSVKTMNQSLPSSNVNECFFSV
uniref:Ovule protein n=1 Tax=Caenorhabditis tropicalis TaxID=1561998 RepID=A0A1I7UZN0_9PELO